MATVENVNIEINKKLLDELAALKAENKRLGKLCDETSHTSAMFLKENEQLQADKSELVEALKDVLKLIDDGFLIRDISKDNDPSWAIKSLPMVLTLGKTAKIRSKHEAK